MSSGFTRALNSFSLPYRNYVQLQSGTASGHDRHCLRTRQLQALNSIPGQAQPTDILMVKSLCTEKTRASHPCRRCLAFLLSASKMPPRRRDTNPSRQRPHVSARGTAHHHIQNSCDEGAPAQCPVIMLAAFESTATRELARGRRALASDTSY